MDIKAYSRRTVDSTLHGTLERYRKESRLVLLVRFRYSPASHMKTSLNVSFDVWKIVEVMDDNIWDVGTWK